MQQTHNCISGPLLKSSYPIKHILNDVKHGVIVCVFAFRNVNLFVVIGVEFCGNEYNFLAYSV